MESDSEYAAFQRQLEEWGEWIREHRDDPAFLRRIERIRAALNAGNAYAPEEE